MKLRCRELIFLAGLFVASLTIFGALVVVFVGAERNPLASVAGLGLGAYGVATLLTPRTRERLERLRTDIIGGHGGTPTTQGGAHEG